MHPDPYREEPVRNLMVDIETMGQMDSPAILSACIMDVGILTDGKEDGLHRTLDEVLDLTGYGDLHEADRSKFIFEEDLGFGRRRYITKVSFSFDGCLRLGMKPEADTLAFWMSRKRAEQYEARRALESGMSVEDGAKHVKEAMLFGMNVDSESPYVWARSPVFDLAHLRTLIKRAMPKEREPWRVRKTRDMRTIEGLSGKPKVDEDEISSGRVETHDPLVDCVVQSIQLKRMLNNIGESL